MHVGKCLSFGVFAHVLGSLSQVDIGTTLGSGPQMEGRQCGELGRVWCFEVRQSGVSITGSKIYSVKKIIQTSIFCSLQWQYGALNNMI